jgi:hypothetical protein
MADGADPPHAGCMTRAIETLISAWVAEQERERVRGRASAQLDERHAGEQDRDAEQPAARDRPPWEP